MMEQLKSVDLNEHATGARLDSSHGACRMTGRNFLICGELVISLRPAKTMVVSTKVTTAMLSFCPDMRLSRSCCHSLEFGY